MIIAEYISARLLTNTQEAFFDLQTFGRVTRSANSPVERRSSIDDERFILRLGARQLPNSDQYDRASWKLAMSTFFRIKSNNYKVLAFNPALQFPQAEPFPSLTRGLTRYQLGSGADFNPRATLQSIGVKPIIAEAGSQGDNSVVLGGLDPNNMALLKKVMHSQSFMEQTKIFH